MFSSTIQIVLFNVSVSILLCGLVGTESRPASHNCLSRPIILLHIEEKGVCRNDYDRFNPRQNFIIQWTLSGT
ncbi:uncharacterized protein ARMOST_02079 [Armillaria ostoyae]|uniref:Secreted protein n=1 Tax=Armillaria ostoyae TaxID=47428 RepID=A0A284QQS4_ARMOS|nr:uncharacterized protein ARMOST_02079 [Armillaria ostoyae]